MPAESEKAEHNAREETAAAAPTSECENDIAGHNSSNSQQKAAAGVTEQTDANDAQKAPPPPPSTTTKKRKASTRISSASARSLLQFTCKTLQSQRLENEVRARELDEKTAALAAERETWEKKIRSVKRRLRDFGHPVDVLETSDAGHSVGGDNHSGGADSVFLPTADWNATLAPTTATTSLITMRDALGSRANGFSGAGVGGIADSHIPASIRHLEVQIRDTLLARKHMVIDMMRDLQSSAHAGGGADSGGAPSSRPTLSRAGGGGSGRWRGSSRRPPSTDLSDADIRAMVQSSVAQYAVALRIPTRAIPALHANARAFCGLFPDEAALSPADGAVRVPLALFGINDWEQLVAFQRVLAAQRRPTDSDSDSDGGAEAVLAARARVGSAAEWTYELSLSPRAEDALWAFATALLLQMRSAGVYGRALLPARGLQSFALASAVSKASPFADDARSEQLLDWAGAVRWSQLVVEDARTHAVVQVVHLPPTLSPAVGASSSPAAQYPALVALVDDLLQHNAQTTRPAVVVLRGIPGSGKSTFSREIAAVCAARTPTPATCVVVSADRYFVGPRGYVFDVKRIGKAHDACKAAFEDALHRNAADVVVVDNTHTQAWEYEHYVQRARASGCRVQVLEMRCPDLTTCVEMAMRNSHGVLVPKVVQMFLRWDADNTALALSPRFEHAMISRNPVSQSPVSTPVYVGLFLDASDRATLLRAFPPRHANVIAEHVTLYYRPTTGYVRGVEIGDTVVVRATELVQDARGQCLRVEIVSPLALKVYTKVPHITVSTANDVGAYYSNELLEDARASRTVLAPDQQVCVTARVGVTVLAQNQRVVMTTSPFAPSRATPPDCEEPSSVVMVRVDEASLESATSAAPSNDSVLSKLAVREQIRHCLGASCRSYRVLCLVASGASGPDRLLKQLEALLLLPASTRHQLVFDKVVVVRSESATSSLRADLEAACRAVSPRSIKRIVVLTTLAHDLSVAASALAADDNVDDSRQLLFQSARVFVSKLELSAPESSARSGVLSAPMSLTLDGAMDCLSLGVQERTRNAIHHGTRLARRAWQAVLGDDVDSEAAVVERIDSTLVGVDAAVVQLCALTSGSFARDVAELRTRLVEELTAVGVHNLALGLEPGVVYFVACSSAEYSPVFRVQIASGTDDDTLLSQRLEFCRQHRQLVTELREAETYTALAELLSATLRSHSVVVPGDMVAAPVLNLVSERTVLAFLKQSPEFTGTQSSSSSSDADSDADTVLGLFSTLLQHLSKWTDDKWRAELASVERLCGADARAAVSAHQLSGAVASALETTQRWEIETSGAIYKAHTSGKRSTAVLQVLLALVVPPLRLKAGGGDSVVTRVVEVANVSSLLDAHVACEAMRKAAASDDVDAEKALFACAPSALSPTRVEIAAASQELLETLETTARLGRLQLSAHEE
ncbi:hypothetical protein PybrP1_006193 [[Pythium] brassicae (nom. inval.)]|nr:hypothetical protein PybrP1_006193 [[Pythium] brassicae (nom. inval.)]